jgi:hypothetical protein
MAAAKKAASEGAAKKERKPKAPQKTAFSIDTLDGGEGQISKVYENHAEMMHDIQAAAVPECTVHLYRRVKSGSVKAKISIVK